MVRPRSIAIYYTQPIQHLYADAHQRLFEDLKRLAKQERRSVEGKGMRHVQFLNEIARGTGFSTWSSFTESVGGMIGFVKVHEHGLVNHVYRNLLRAVEQTAPNCGVPFIRYAMRRYILNSGYWVGTNIDEKMSETERWEWEIFPTDFPDHLLEDEFFGGLSLELLKALAGDLAAEGDWYCVADDDHYA